MTKRIESKDMMVIEIRDELEEHLMMHCVDRMVCDVTDKYRTVVTVTMRREMIPSEEEKD